MTAAPPPPFVVAFEGRDRVGKTKLIRELERLLNDERIPCATWALPSFSVVPWIPCSRSLTPTECLEHVREHEPDLATMLLLLNCARAVTSARASLPPGAVALHDRSSLSTAVYQGPAEAILDLVPPAARPDLVVYLPPEKGAVTRSALETEDASSVFDLWRRYSEGVELAQARGWHVLDVKREGRDPAALALHVRTLLHEERRRWLAGLP